jgi:uncharacterized protein
MKAKCPICKKPVSHPKGKDKAPWFPFCCERCKLIDLGKWLDADYRVPVEPEPEDEGTGEGN